MADDDDNGTSDEDGVDLEELVGRVLDARGLSEDRLSKIDGLDSIGDTIRTIFKEEGGGRTRVTSKGTSTFDEDGFLAKVGQLVDEKIAASPASQPKKGALLRYLGL